MKKFIILSIIFIFFLGIFVPSGFVQATAFTDCRNPLVAQGTDILVASNQCKDKANEEELKTISNTQKNAQSQDPDTSCGWNPFTTACILELVKNISYLILTIMSWILGLAGMLLNLILDQTIVKMAANLSGMTGIDIAWKVIRDVLNISFIFILLYNGIQIILSLKDKDSAKGIISGIIITSILINFSMFFTKVIIDASNVVTIGFYKSIEAAGKTTSLTGTNGQAITVEKGISGAFMNSLHVTSLYGPKTIPVSVTSEIIIYLFGSVLFLILSFIFFAVSAMFVMRYFILIFLLMFSPLGFIGFGLPQMASMQKQWWETLMGQCTFAPIYMFSTWVILTLIGSPGFIPDSNATASFANITSTGADQTNAIGLIINFAVIIGLTVMSLTEAKKRATQGSALIGQYTGKLTALAGGVALGGAAIAGRRIIGGTGQALLSSGKLKDKATESGVGGFAARLALKTSDKATKSTFDARTKLGGLSDTLGVKTDFGKSGKDTYKSNVDDREKKKVEFGKLLVPTDRESAEHKAKTEEYLNSDEYKNSEQYKKAEAEKLENESKLKPETEKEKELEQELKALKDAQNPNSEKAKTDKENEDKLKKEIEDLQKQSTNPNLAMTGGKSKILKDIEDKKKQLEEQQAKKIKEEQDITEAIKTKEGELKNQKEIVETVKKENAGNMTEQKVRETQETIMRQDLKDKRANSYADFIEKKDTTNTVENEIRAKAEANKKLNSEEFKLEEEEKKKQHILSKEYEKEMENLRKSNTDDASYNKAKEAYQKAWMSNAKKILTAMNGGQIEKKDESGNVVQQKIDQMQDNPELGWLGKTGNLLTLVTLGTSSTNRTNERSRIASKLRKGLGGKSINDQIADLAKKAAKEEEDKKNKGGEELKKAA